MLIQPTLQKLRELKLIGFAEVLEQFVNDTQLQAMTIEELIGLMVDKEICLRDNRKTHRLQTQALLRFKQAQTQDIDYHHQRQLKPVLMRQLTTCQWISQQHANLIFVGPTGIGKTYLACALANQACQQKLSVRFYRLSKLIEALRMAHADGSYAKFIKQLAKINLLIIDDWGNGDIARHYCHDLLEIIEDRYQLQSTLITTQLPQEKWHEYIGDPTTADSICDRLLNNAYIVQLSGESMRRTQKNLAHVDHLES